MQDETPASEIEAVEPASPPSPAASTVVTPPPETPAQTPVQPVVTGAVAPPPPPAPTGPLPPPPSPAEVVQPAAEPKVMPAEWPHAGYTGPQPWEADNPPALTQNRLMVSSGSAGQQVVELAALLAHLGYGTSISTGQNPHALYDSGVSNAVRKFCEDYGVVEDPQVRQARTEDTVGPWIWEALTRAVHKQLAQA